MRFATAAGAIRTANFIYRAYKWRIDMTIRENLELWESEYLSPYATLSASSKGRDREEEQCDIRPVFQRDRDRILHSSLFGASRTRRRFFCRRREIIIGHA